MFFLHIMGRLSFLIVMVCLFVLIQYLITGGYFVLTTSGIFWEVGEELPYQYSVVSAVFTMLLAATEMPKIAQMIKQRKEKEKE